MDHPPVTLRVAYSWAKALLLVTLMLWLVIAVLGAVWIIFRG